MTLSEMLQNVLDDIDESISDVTLVEKLTRYINRGYKELAKRENLNKLKTLTTSDGRVKIPYDCYKVLHCFYAGETISYKLKGSYIYVDTPTVDIMYCYTPDTLESDDEFETKECNSEFISSFTKYLYYLSESMNTESSAYKGEFESMKIEKNIPTYEKIIDVYGVI